MSVEKIATDDALRAQFEAWMDSRGYTKFDLRRDHINDYQSGAVYSMWIAYQAASAAQSAELARLRVLAARYEWLRDADDLPPISSRSTKRRGDFIWIYDGAKLDAAIDAALASRNGGESHG